MLTGFLYDYLPDKKEYTYGNKKIIISFRQTKELWFKKRFFNMAVMTELSEHEFDELKPYFDFLLDALIDEAIAHKHISARISWLFLTDNADKNLFEKINSLENRHYRNMDNHFVLISKNTWEIFFNPEGIENRVISRRLMDLRQEAAASIGEEENMKIAAELKHVYNTLLYLLDAASKRFFVKKIKRNPIRLH